MAFAGRTPLGMEGDAMDALHKKPQPLYDCAIRPLCPVCGHVSYSSAGIHPQCAMRAADKLQIIRAKSRKSAKAKSLPMRPGRYEKQCPSCRVIQHIRKQTCNC